MAAQPVMERRMRRIDRLLHAGIPLFALLLVLVAVGLPTLNSQSTPPPELQGQSLSIAAGDPLSGTGVHPADILGSGGLPLIACPDLGLLCDDPTTGAVDDINALSFGWDFSSLGLPPFQFSVAAGASGTGGTAVRIEADCAPPQPQADAFETALDGGNFQDLDGDGAPCGTNGGFGLGLTEGATGDNVDALERDPCQFVDLECDGLPDAPVFVALAPGSPSLALLGATAADILMTGSEFVAVVWAEGVSDLGLVAGDAIDALCVRENGDGLYGSEDQVLVSLAPGSPTLAALSAGPGDLLRPGRPYVAYASARLGLQSSDDVDALTCAAALDFTDLYLPVVFKE
jgi:hypothetical protein